jgi:hypothetical protein
MAGFELESSGEPMGGMAGFESCPLGREANLPIELRCEGRVVLRPMTTFSRTVSLIDAIVIEN